MNNLIAKVASYKTELEVPDVDADFNAPFLDVGKDILGWLLAGGTVIAVLAAIVSVILISTGVLGERHKTKGWIAFGVSLLAAAILGSITALVGWAGGLSLV